jgi:type II secretory pathway component PulC
MKDNITPEERLLKLIRKEGKHHVTAAKDGPMPSKRALSFPRGMFFFSRFFLTHAKQCVAILVIGSSLYCGYAFLYPVLAMKKIKLPEITPLLQNAAKDESSLVTKPLESYTEEFKDRQIFQNPLTEDTLKGSQKSLETDLLNDFSLIGIVSGENPQAIIEDKKNQKTYYVSKGQSIGAFKVEGIQEGKVVLGYQGNTYDLYL